MMFFQLLWVKVWPYLAAVGAALAAIFAIRQSGKAEGKAEARQEQMESDLEAGRNRNEAISKVDSMDDDAVRELARKRMRDASR